MTILTVGLDPEFARVLADMLAPDGVRLDPRGSVSDAQRAGGARFGAVVIDGRPSGAEISALVSNLRAGGRLASDAAVVVVGDRADATLRALVDRIPAAVWTPRPPSLLDLAELLRRAGARARPSVEVDVDDDDDDGDAADPASVPSVVSARSMPSVSAVRPEARRAWSMENCRRVARWWARRASGSVTLDGAGEWHLALGGPVGASALQSAERALQGGVVVLDPGEVAGPGNRAALGALLWRAAAESVGPAPAADWVPTLGPLSERIAELPLRPGTPACLPRMGGADTIEAIARAGGVPVVDLAADLAALAFLGLVGRQGRPHSRSVSAPSPVPRPPAAPSREVVFDPVSTPSVQRFATAPPRLTAPVIERPFGASAPSQPRAERTADSPTHGWRHESVDDPATSPTSNRVPVQRLRREAATLREADPWTVLGLPRRSPPDTIRFTAARMKHRYQILDQDPDPEVRALAAEVLQRVASAEVELLAMKEVVAETPVDDWIRRGVDELAKREWARAEKCFAMAREASPDNPLALAHLGWARFQNPSRPRTVREDEGKELITLALQFDANCAQGWKYMGEIAAARGDVDRARQCFNSAARIDPSFAMAKAR